MEGELSDELELLFELEPVLVLVRCVAVVEPLVVDAVDADEL